HGSKAGDDGDKALTGDQQPNGGAQGGKVAEVLADALGGGHGGGHDIQAVLDHLAPTGEHGLHALQQLHAHHEMAIFNHGGMHGGNPLAAMEVHVMHAQAVVAGHA